MRSESWSSPNYGDGAWHATPGCEAIDVERIEPLKDRILVEFLPEKIPYEKIVTPEIAVNRFGEPSVHAVILRTGKGVRVLATGEERSCCCVRAGDTVVLGTHFDWVSQDGRYAICQEMDVRAILSRKKVN